MNVEDELLALTSLIGSIAMGIETSRASEAWLAREGISEITDPGVMLAVRLSGVKAALQRVSSAKEALPQSRLLAKLVTALEQHSAETEANGLEELKRMNWSPGAGAQHPPKAWSNVIQLFPDKPRGEPES